MADPVERDVPKDQPKGEAQAQQDFLAQSAGTPVTPLTPPPLVEPEPEPDDEEDGTAVVEFEDVDEPVDLINQVLLRDTAFPDEPVTAGLGLVGREGASVADLLDRVLATSGLVAPDVAALADHARQLGL